MHWDTGSRMAPQAARPQITLKIRLEPGSWMVCFMPSIHAHSRMIPSSMPQDRSGVAAAAEKVFKSWVQMDWGCREVRESICRPSIPSLSSRSRVSWGRFWSSSSPPLASNCSSYSSSTVWADAGRTHSAASRPSISKTFHSLLIPPPPFR